MVRVHGVSMPPLYGGMLSGRSLHLIGSLAELARVLQPTVPVLEDVDQGHARG